MSSTETVIQPRVSDPQLDGGHERFTHIVLEGFKTEGDEFISVGNSVIEGMINDTAVKALCGKVWVPRNDPARNPICPTCKEIAQQMGWKVPGH